MDKNKSDYKLKGIPPIYYINLDAQPERVEYMEEQFKYWEIENYTRVSEKSNDLTYTDLKSAYTKSNLINTKNLIKFN